MESADDVELQKGRHDRRWRRNDAVKLADAEDPGENGDGENTDENRTSYFQRVENGDDEEAEDREKGTGLFEVAEANEGRLVGDDDAGALERDDRQKETDAGSNRASERMRDAGNQPAAHAGYRQQDENTARNEDRAERLLP